MGFRRHSNFTKRSHTSITSSASNSAEDVAYLDERGVNDSLKAAQVTFQRHKARQAQTVQSQQLQQIQIHNALKSNVYMDTSPGDDTKTNSALILSAEPSVAFPIYQYTPRKNSATLNSAKKLMRPKRRRRVSPSQISTVTQDPPQQPSLSVKSNSKNYRGQTNSASDTDLAHIAAILAHNSLSDPDLSRGGFCNINRGPSPTNIASIRDCHTYSLTNNSTLTNNNHCNSNNNIDNNNNISIDHSAGTTAGTFALKQSPNIGFDSSVQLNGNYTKPERLSKSKVRASPTMAALTSSPELKTWGRLSTDNTHHYELNGETTTSGEDASNPHQRSSSPSTIIPPQNLYYSDTGSYTSCGMPFSTGAKVTGSEHNANTIYDLDIPISSLIQPKKHKTSKVKRFTKMFIKGSSVPIVPQTPTLASQTPQRMLKQRQFTVQTQTQLERQPQSTLTPSSSSTFLNSGRAYSTPASPNVNTGTISSLGQAEATAAPYDTPLRFKTTMRFEKRKKSFNEDKPWKEHKRADFLSERERKRYEAVWVSNRFAYLNLLDWWPSMDISSTENDGVETTVDAVKCIDRRDKGHSKVFLPETTLSTAGLGISFGTGKEKQSQKKSLTETAAATVLGYEEEQLLLQQQQQQRLQPYNPTSQSQVHFQQDNDEKQYTTQPSGTGELDDYDEYDAFEDDDLDEEDEVDDVMDQQVLGISSEDEPIDSNLGSKETSRLGPGSALPSVSASTSTLISTSVSGSGSGSGSDISSDRDNFLLDLPRDGLILNLVVKDIWERSNLPSDLLRQIYDLVDLRKDGTLDRKSFIVGMWLVDQCLYGRKLPTSINQMIWDSVDKFALNVYQRRKERTLQEKKMRRRKRDIVGRELKHIRSGIKHVHL